MFSVHEMECIILRLRGMTHLDPVLHVLVVVSSQLIHYNPLRKLHLHKYIHGHRQQRAEQLQSHIYHPMGRAVGSLSTLSVISGMVAECSYG